MKKGPVLDLAHENQVIQNQEAFPPTGRARFRDSSAAIILNEELKKIKERLKTEAVAYPAEHLPLLEKDSEGSQWIARGNGCECRIVFPDPKTKSEFDPCTSDFLTIRSLAGDHLKTLFRKFTLFRPVDKKTFRGQVNNLLAPKAADQLLELCSSPSEPKAVFKSLPGDKKHREATR